jgi:hypothetical protein
MVAGRMGGRVAHRTWEGSRPSKDAPGQWLDHSSPFGLPRNRSRRARLNAGGLRRSLWPEDGKEAGGSHRGEGMDILRPLPRL